MAGIDDRGGVEGGGESRGESRKGNLKLVKGSVAPGSNCGDEVQRATFLDLLAAHLTRMSILYHAGSSWLSRPVLLG